MNDDKIIDALRTAPVTARTLDPDQIITRAHRRRVRTWTASAGAVAAVTATIAAAVGLNAVGSKVADDAVVTPSPTLTTVGTMVTLGPIEEAKANELASTCLRSYAGSADAPKEIVYAMRIRDLDGRPNTFAVAVRDKRDDKLYGCFAFGDAEDKGPYGEELLLDPGMQLPGEQVPEGSLERLSGQSIQTSVPVQSTGKRYIRIGTWYRVKDDTPRIRQRYLVHDVPTGSWFEADVANDYVFILTWLELPIKKVKDPTTDVNTVQLETYAVGRNGKATRQFGRFDDRWPGEMFTP
jgi:hypothetical protein